MTTDTFWQEQIAQHAAERGQKADPGACGTCRRRTEDGNTVEHDGCAQRATLTEAPDMPSWELLVEMTEQEKADLPARFHVPRFDDLGQPNAWLCAVCWGDGWVTGWPCKTATKHGTEVFTPEYEAEQAHKRQQAEIDRLRAENAELVRALGLNEEVAS